MAQHIMAFLGGIAIGACMGHWFGMSSATKNMSIKNDNKTNNNQICMENENNIDNLWDTANEIELLAPSSTPYSTDEIIAEEIIVDEPAADMSESCDALSCTPITTYRDQEYDKFMRTNAIIIAARNRSAKKNHSVH